MKIVIINFSNTNFSITAPCTTKTYQKDDGSYYCGFVIQDSLTWFQAKDECNARGGRLPEISSVNENIAILKMKVINTNALKLFALVFSHSI